MDMFNKKYLFGCVDYCMHEGMSGPCEARNGKCCMYTVCTLCKRELCAASRYSGDTTFGTTNELVSIGQ